MTETRIKTEVDLRLTPQIYQEIGMIADKLGISRNAAVTMGIALLRAQMTPILDADRESRMDKLEKIRTELNGFFEQAMSLP